MRLPARFVAVQRALTCAAFDRLSVVPSTHERPHSTPAGRARQIATRAARKASLFSGMLALPGSVTAFTVVPDLLAVWNVQSQMVSDIAGAYGEAAWLTRQQLLLCLFKHGSARALGDVLVRVGEGAAKKCVSQQLMHRTATKVGIDVGRRAVAQTAARAVPIIGAMGVGAFAYFDTQQVGRTTIGLLEEKKRGGVGRMSEIEIGVPATGHARRVSRQRRRVIRWA